MKMFFRFLVLIFFAFLVFLAVSSGTDLPAQSVLNFNQTYIENAYSKLDLENTEAVFWHVFSNLPKEVTVYPSENYYYFTFYANGKNFWGNIRLSPEERDRGLLNFAYWEFNDDPQNPDDFYSKYKQFNPQDGLRIKLLNDSKYAVIYRGRKVVFNFNQLSQDLPKSAKLAEGEKFFFRTFDESGFQFFLIFNETNPHFMYVLNEEDGLPDELMPLRTSDVQNIDGGNSGTSEVQRVSDERVLIGKRTKFVFYDDQENNRKILIGVWAENIKRNNYFDGPFDQLADNYIAGGAINLGQYIEQVYPYTRGRINQYGHFTDTEGSRVAITPYYEYYSVDEFSEMLSYCQNQPAKDFYQCITYDDKEGY